MNRLMRYSLALAAVASAAVVGDLDAQGAPTLQALLTEADTGNPRILAACKAVEAAAARVPQAGALPDPVLGVGVVNLPVADPSLGREMMTMTTLQLAGRLPWPGKLGLGEDIARMNADAAGWELERTRQAVRADVKEAYYRIYFLDRALDITRRNEGLVGDFTGLTSAKYAVGTGAQPDVLRAQVERTRLSEQVVALVEQRAAAGARLNALLGRSTETPIPRVELPVGVRAAALERGTSRLAFASAALADVAPPSQVRPPGVVATVQELQRRARDGNPMLRARERRIAAAERAVALAGKASLPDVGVSVAYGRRPDFGDLASVTLTVPLPVFSGRKQDQAVVERRSMLEEARADRAAAEDDIDTEIATLAAALQRARDQLVLLNDGILPQARTALASATASYRVGGVDFLTLLDAQVTLYRHELDYHRLLSDFAANLAALERAVGAEVIR